MSERDRSPFREQAKQFMRICKTNSCGNFRRCEKCTLLVPMTSLMRHLLAGGHCPADPPQF